MCLGYAFGAWVGASSAFRQKASTALGIAFLAACVLLRSANSYGDVHRWHLLPTTRQSIMDFLAVEKYPLSLQYVLVTLGLLLLLYVLLDLCFSRTWAPKLRAFVEIYGRVPFFLLCASHSFDPWSLRYSGPTFNMGTGVSEPPRRHHARIQPRLLPSIRTEPLSSRTVCENAEVEY
jgi:hypothetical protein